MRSFYTFFLFKSGGIHIVEVSIVLPAYNEAKRIEGTVERTAAALREITSSFELIMSEDAPLTAQIIYVNLWQENIIFVMHLHSDECQGRGRALNRAFKASKGEILGYIDVDLATDMDHLKELIQSIRDGYDFATGSTDASGKTMSSGL